MEELIYFNNLYDIYNEFLTSTQRELFCLYYRENLSMQEIADQKKVSKSFVGKYIKDSEKKLTDIENKLHLLEIKNDLIYFLEETDNEKGKNIIQEIINKI